MKKKDIVTLIAGMALGAVLTGGAAAAGILAEPSWSPIYVDGQQVQMTAYNIAGNNYVKLRDIGKAVGFNVYFEHGVQVDSDASYTGIAPVKAASQPAAVSAGTLRISSVKGTELTVGERSSLLIDPPGASAASSNPAVAALEQVAGYWVVVAQAPGNAAITVTDSMGKSSSLDLIVKADTSAPNEIDLNANMEIRLEMARLVNQLRRENGLAELSVNESLMNAAQDVSAQRATEHRPYDHMILPKYGWDHGAMYNLVTLGSADSGSAARIAVSSWIDSPGHLQTMLKENAACIGTGVTVAGGRTYCYMVVGAPGWVNPYTE